jgi:hypothetical protein
MIGAYVLTGELAAAQPLPCVSLWNGPYRSTRTVRKVWLYKQSSLW